MKYKHLFIDLDDTVWNFSENAKDTFYEVFVEFSYHRFFESFEQFYTLYKKRNAELWLLYGAGKITKEELNRERFNYPLAQIGVHDSALSMSFAQRFFSLIKEKKKLMPYALEGLTYLKERDYSLHVLSNGFRSLQEEKISKSGVTSFFDTFIFSEDIQVHKPNVALFEYALKQAGATAQYSLMMGDNFQADIVGAKQAGWDQLYYNFNQKQLQESFLPTYEVSSWKNIQDVL
jgi:putative hydrolase of the HAD superfamily